VLRRRKETFAVRIIAACIQALTLAACGAASRPPPDISSAKSDGLKQVVDAQTQCFTREAQDKALSKVDINTAALAVQARCITETQRFKVFAARNTIDTVTGGVEGYQDRMRQDDADDLQYIRQVLALVRISK
jgi:hypothetical protein